MFKHQVNKLKGKLSRSSSGRSRSRGSDGQNSTAGSGLFAGTTQSSQRQEQLRKCLEDQAREQVGEDTEREEEEVRGEEEGERDEEEVAARPSTDTDADAEVAADAEAAADAELAATLGPVEPAGGSSTAAIVR